MVNRVVARSLLRHAAFTTNRCQTTCVVTLSSLSSLSSVIEPHQTMAQSATLPRLFSSTAENLSHLLARELDEERENAAMPEDLQQLSDQVKSEWRIVDDETNGLVKLFRNTGNVAINFHCQESLQPDVFGGEDDDDEGEEDEASAPVRFSVATSKAGKTLVLWCLSEGGEAIVEGLAVTTADADSLFRDGISSSSYQGPEFTELPEDVRDAFTEFVNVDCGVSSDVAAFIAMYADYKEQCQYVKFLTEVQSIVQ